MSYNFHGKFPNSRGVNSLIRKIIEMHIQFSCKIVRVLVENMERNLLYRRYNSSTFDVFHWCNHKIMQTFALNSLFIEVNQVLLILYVLFYAF